MGHPTGLFAAARLARRMLDRRTMGGKRGALARRRRLFWRTAAAILALLTLAVTLPAGIRLATQTQRARAELVERTVATAKVTADTVADLTTHRDVHALARLVTA